MCVRSLVFSICILFGISCLFVFADDTTPSAITDAIGDASVVSSIDDNGNTTVIIDNSALGQQFNDLANAIINSNSERDSEITSSDSLQLRSVNVSNETITASDANGFKAVVLGLLGDYTSIVTDYTYSNTQGYTQHSIDVTPDWSWICCCAIFIVVVYCFFRLVGGFLCKR